MKNSDLKHVDQLITDEQFRSVIHSLADNQPIPDQIVASYSQYSREDLEFAKELIIASKEEQESIDYGNKDKIWESIEAATTQFDRDREASGTYLTVHKTQTIWKRAMMVAAVFIGLVCVSIWFTMDQAHLNEQSGPVAELVTKANPSGQKSRITLPDGSIAHLNAESELVYDRNFTGDQRKLYLKKGEAYFEVSKNKEKPFVVIANNISVTALGTEFNVNAFDEGLKVALVEGSVMVSNTSNNDQLIMNPTEILEFDPVANGLKIISGSAQDLADWKDQILHFNHTPIAEALGILSRWYAVEISLENTAPKDLTVSGKFNNSSLELVLNNLSYSLDFEYVMNNKDIKIKFKK